MHLSPRADLHDMGDENLAETFGYVARELGKRLALQTKAMELAKQEIVMLPLHQQPIAWVMSDKVQSVVQQADGKNRHWLTTLKK